MSYATYIKSEMLYPGQCLLAWVEFLPIRRGGTLEGAERFQRLRVCLRAADREMHGIRKVLMTSDLATRKEVSSPSRTLRNTAHVAACMVAHGLLYTPISDIGPQALGNRVRTRDQNVGTVCYSLGGVGST